MEQALAFAIALTEQRDEQHLCHWWVSTLHASFQQRVFYLECWMSVGANWSVKAGLRGRRSRWYWQWMTFSSTGLCVAQGTTPHLGVTPRGRS